LEYYHAFLAQEPADDLYPGARVWCRYPAGVRLIVQIETTRGMNWLIPMGAVRVGVIPLGRENGYGLVFDILTDPEAPDAGWLVKDVHGNWWGAWHDREMALSIAAGHPGSTVVHVTAPRGVPLRKAFPLRIRQGD